MTYYYNADDLKNYITRFFVHYGVPKEHAEIIADVTIAADLRGVDSHGIGKLYVYYGNRLAAGLIDPKTSGKTIRETGSTILVDGENGLGHVVGYKAMEKCMQKAQETGLGIASVNHSNHYGIAGYYAMMALQENMIGISLTNSEALIAPTFGKKRVLGTNPIAVAVPSGKERPYVLDMATSIKPLGRVLIHEALGKKIPLGWGIDPDGNLTEDPQKVHEGGAVLPLGGTEEMSGYKGYGLSLLVDILSGVLSGGGFGLDVGSPLATEGSIANVGHFFMAINIESIRPLTEFRRDMDTLIHQIKSSPKAPGQQRIFIHGEKEFDIEDTNKQSGIPIAGTVVEDLKARGDRIGVEFDPQPVRIE
jgi:LDH2 family malate/lactate/ureidoglycolate dehydrogenase